MTGLALLPAFLLGLLGSTHCLAMCGGIAGVIGLSQGTRPRLSASLPTLLVYNLGRLTSYATAGALAGLAGATLFGTIPSVRAQLIARLVSAVFMILLALYLAGWTRALGALERAGERLWRRIEPLGRRLLPLDRTWKVYGFGLVWGWLPCGLVYAALVASATVGDPARGAAFMLAFGAGTLPAMLAVGVFARWFNAAVRRPGFRYAVAVAVMLVGLATLFGLGAPSHHH